MIDAHGSLYELFWKRALRRLTSCIAHVSSLQLVEFAQQDVKSFLTEAGTLVDAVGVLASPAVAGGLVELVTQLTQSILVRDSNPLHQLVVRRFRTGAT